MTRAARGGAAQGPAPPPVHGAAARPQLDRRLCGAAQGQRPGGQRVAGRERGEHGGERAPGHDRDPPADGGQFVEQRRAADPGRYSDARAFSSDHDRAAARRRTAGAAGSSVSAWPAGSAATASTASQRQPGDAPEPRVPPAGREPETAGGLARRTMTETGENPCSRGCPPGEGTVLSAVTSGWTPCTRWSAHMTLPACCGFGRPAVRGTPPRPRRP